MNDAKAERQLLVPPRGRSVGVFLTQALFIGVLLSAIAGGLWTITRDQTRLATAPGLLAGMPLQDVTTGEAALAMIERLHGKDVGLKDGWVAIYQHGGVLWVGEAQDQTAAEALTAQMTERIEDGNPLFQHLGTESFGTVTTHKVTDGSTTHYYYRLGARIVWISEPKESGRQFVEEAIAELSET